MDAKEILSHSNVKNNIISTDISFFKKCKDIKAIIKFLAKFDKKELIKCFNIIKNANQEFEKKINEIFIYCCKHNLYNLVEYLLKEEKLDPSLEENIGFILACQNGHINIVKILIEDNRVKCNTNNDLAFRLSCKLGHKDIVELLLKNPTINPSANNQEGLKTAIKFDHIQVVKLLLKDKRIDITADNNLALRLAYFLEKLDIYQLLLTEYIKIKKNSHNNGINKNNYKNKV